MDGEVFNSCRWCSDVHSGVRWHGVHAWLKLQSFSAHVLAMVVSTQSCRSTTLQQIQSSLLSQTPGCNKIPCSHEAASVYIQGTINTRMSAQQQNSARL